MITAIDFGCYAVRSVRRGTDPQAREIVLMSERSEYTMLPSLSVYRDTLESRGISYAECDGTLVAFGNQAEPVRCLSRMPLAPLFTDGRVPTQDAPARQILDVLTKAMLPDPGPGTNRCCFTAPGGTQNSRNAEFLARLIRMQGFEPILCSATDAANLACGSENRFSGITICMGTEQTEISVSRFGVEIAADAIDVGSNLIDAELARQLKIQVYDRTGECYLDLPAVRDWKHNPRVHLRHAVGERERTLSRLYGIALDRIASAVRQLIDSPAVSSVMKDERFSVLCVGGPATVGGFSEVLTERLVEQQTAGRILSVRVPEDPSVSVVQGLLIQGALDAEQSSGLAA